MGRAPQVVAEGLGLSIGPMVVAQVGRQHNPVTHNLVATVGKVWSVAQSLVIVTTLVGMSAVDALVVEFKPMVRFLTGLA